MVIVVTTNHGIVRTREIYTFLDAERQLVIIVSVREYLRVNLPHVWLDLLQLNDVPVHHAVWIVGALRVRQVVVGGWPITVYW